MSHISSMGSPSLRALLTVSIPLMLTSATEGLMLFADRAFLAHYSVEAMNVASATFLTTGVFIFFGVAIAAIAEVLAGQYNGEKRFNLVARPIWQMLWFSLGLFLIFIPLGLWGKSWLIPEELKEAASGYFTVICFSGPLWAVQVVLAGFFACTGRSKWLTPVAILANLMNVVLDYLFIFGFGSTPALGATGAALATSLAQVIHVLVLFLLFLRPKEREIYGTGKMVWYPKEIVQALRVGIPNAMSHGVEVTGWALLYYFATRVSMAYLTVLSAVSAINSLLGFLNEGLKQGVVVIASNLIGAEKFKDIKKLLSSGLKLQLLLGLIAFFPLVIGADYSISLLGKVAEDSSLHHDLKLGLFCMWLFIFFDGLVWILNGILTAGGDTKVTMLINIGTVWFIVILPSFLFLGKDGFEPWFMYLLIACYSGVNCLLHALRYRQRKWQNKLTSTS